VGDTCTYCKKPLDGVSQSYWGNECHIECNPANIEAAAAREGQRQIGRAVGVPDVFARGVVRDTTDPSGRTMYVLFDRAMSDDEMRNWHDGINALHPASPLGAVAMREKAAMAARLAGPAQDLADYELSTVGKDRRVMAMRCEADIRALPLPTPAELLAAAAELPEVRALVELLKQARGKIHSLYHGWHRQTDTALAPFARKGE